jgi:hypothetical protein
MGYCSTPEERRRTPRHQLGRVAAIMFGQGEEHSCLVKDFSDGGVRLQVNGFEIPDDFALLFAPGETRSKRPLQGRLALRKGRRCQVHRPRALILFLPQHLPGLQVDQMHPRTGEARKRLIGVIIVDQPALAAKLLNNIGFRFTPKGNCGRASPPPSGLGLRNESRSDAGQTRAHPSA